MTTLSQLSKDIESGTKRGKLSYDVHYEKVVIRDGLNIRRKITEDQVEFFAKSYAAKKYVPSIIVRVTEDGTIEVLDGHHRLLGFRLAVSRGADIKSIRCEEFEGDEADAILLMIKSAGGIALTPLDRGEGYLRLLNLGKKPAEIAEEAQRSESDVNIHLSLMKCSDYMKSMVMEEKLNYSYAVELTREHGVEGADEVFRAQLEHAQTKGKDKVTKGTTVSSGVTPKQLRRFIELISCATFKIKNDKAHLVLDAEFSQEVAEILELYNKAE